MLSLFERVRSGKAAVSEEAVRKKPPSFFVVSRFPYETATPFLRFHLVAFGEMFRPSPECRILPNWQSPRPSPFLTLPLRRKVFENSIDQRRSKKPESEFIQPNNQTTSKRESHRPKSNQTNTTTNRRKSTLRRHHPMTTKSTISKPTKSETLQQAKIRKQPATKKEKKNYLQITPDAPLVRLRKIFS